MLIVHHNDEDGRCAATIVFWYLEGLRKEAEALGARDASRFCGELYETDYHQKEPPWDRIKAHRGDIWILDFSYPPAVMSELYKKYGNKIVWIDHHITAIERIAEPFRGSRDPLKSSCLLTWEYLHVNSPIPKAVQLISQYDTGNFTQPARQLLKALAIENQDPEKGIWLELLQFDSSGRGQTLVDDLIAIGEVLIRYDLQRGKELIKQYGAITSLHGHKAMKLNAPLRSDVLEASLQCYPDVPIAWIWTECKSDGRTVRKNILYSNTVDVGQIAKRLGGGGHKGAAGFIQEVEDPSLEETGNTPDPAGAD